MTTPPPSRPATPPTPPGGLYPHTDGPRGFAARVQPHPSRYPHPSMNGNAWRGATYAPSLAGLPVFVNATGRMGCQRAGWQR